MSESPEMMHQIGAFEPFDAKKLLAELEAQGIAFEVETDNSPLFEMGRGALLSVGMQPEGAKLAVFVREPDLQRATDLLKRIFPE